MVRTRMIRAGAFHDRVRDGNGWDDPALTTRKRMTRVKTVRERQRIGCDLRLGSSGVVRSREDAVC